MEIDLPVTAEIRLAQHAKAAGYDDVLIYVAEQLQAIAGQPTPDELEPLRDDELAASLQILRESDADMNAGRTQDLREALHEIAGEVGVVIER